MGSPVSAVIANLYIVLKGLALRTAPPRYVDDIFTIAREVWWMSSWITSITRLTMELEEDG